jgi:S-adenosylmethionine uptake transporter
MNLRHRAAICSPLLFALSLVLLNSTKATETDTALVASLLLVLTALSLAVSLARGCLTAVAPPDVAFVAVAGFMLFSGHVLLVRAFRIGDASVVAPFQYSQIVWGCLFGALLFGALKCTPSSAQQLSLLPAGGL